MRAVCLALVLCAGASFGQASDAAKARPKLLVSDLLAQGVAQEQAAAFTDAVVGTLEERGLFQVLSGKDVRTILSAARRRELTGACQPNEESCAVNLGGALGARFVLSGALSRYGDTYELSLQLVDTVKGRRTAQSSRLSHDLTTLRLLVPYAVAEATGTALPPPASRVFQYSAIGAGAALVVAGGFLGMAAISQQHTLNDELCPGGPDPQGACHPGSLRPLSFYEDQNSSLGRQKTIGLSLMAAGVALAAAGLYFMPPPEGGPRVAVVPQANGLAVVGVLP